MLKNEYPKAQNPLLLRFHRLIDAFAKSDDERYFYLDRIEGFIIFADLDKGQKELDDLFAELTQNHERYLTIHKMTCYETKKFMEGFVNEKVYDIDTKEKLLDIIQSKEARENFLEFIYDHLVELEKWQQYYVERMRIRIIEWLRSQGVVFVFEEDLELSKTVMEKVKQQLFDVKVGKDVSSAREAIVQKSKTYYSTEALNPRPKRGRPPKQQVKIEVEPQLTGDIYTTVPFCCRLFLYLPDIANASAITFSSRYGTEAELLASLRGATRTKTDSHLEILSQRLESLRQISSRLANFEGVVEEKETKILKAVSRQEPLSDQDVEGDSKKHKIFDAVRGALPHKKEKSLKNETSSISHPKTIKKVTLIKKK
jgi:hypothetical protein